MKSKIFTLLTLTFCSFSLLAQYRGSPNPVKKSSLNEIRSKTIHLKPPGNFTIPVSNVKRNLFSGLNTKQVCSDTIFYEDFQSQTIPATWGNIDGDGNTDANGRPMEWYVMTDLETTIPGDTNYVAASSSWFTPFATANNFLITDTFAVCDSNFIMEWKSAPFEGPAFADGYQVIISSDPSSPNQFTDTIAIFAEDVTGAGNFGSGIAHSSWNGNRGVLQQWSVSLAAYDGEIVSIIFHHNSNDDNLIMIDDIVVRKEIYDLATGLNNGGYFLIPDQQAVQMNNFYLTWIGNLGELDAPEVDLVVDIYSSGLLDFTDSINYPITTLPAGFDTISPLTQGHTPSDTGFYSMFCFPLNNNTDQDIENDTSYNWFWVNDSILARDNNTVNGGLNVGGGGILGSNFDVLTTDYLTSVSIWRELPTAGDSVTLVLYSTTSGVPNTLLASSALYIESDTISGFRLYQFALGTITLTPGEYFVGLAEADGTLSSIGTTNNIFYPMKMWFSPQSNGWIPFDSSSFQRTLLIRPNFGVSNPVSDESIIENQLNIALFPNPTSDRFYISSTSSKEHQGTLTIYNQVGQLINTFSLNTLKNGIDTKSWESGIYNVIIQTNSKTEYQKIVVLK